MTRDIDALPPIRLADLVALGDCAVCGKTQLQGAVPLFYRVTIERGGFDAAPIRLAAGLEMAFGPLASVMGRDEPLARVIDGPVTVFVHEDCADRVGHLLSLFPTEGAKP